MSKIQYALVAAGLVGLLGWVAVPAASDPPEASEALDGLIEPYLFVNVSPAVDGLIEDVLVERGDLVTKGQALAELESSVEKASLELSRVRAEAVAAVRSGESRVKLAKLKLAKDKELFLKEIISPDDYEERQTELELAELSLLEAQENQKLAELDYLRAKAALALRTVRSPIDGVVVERLMAPGELVNRTGQVIIVKLAQIDPLRVEVFAPVSLLGTIAVGMKAEVLPESPIDRPLEATVTVVDRVVDAASGTFGVRLELPNPEYKIPAGLKCSVRFPR